MSMHKIFFGTIVFFSLAFLAACGSGSGSSGAAGTAGATGATGAAGTIAVPDADSDLAIAAGTAIDSVVAMGTVTDVVFTVSGTDNVTSDSRLRYHLYEGSSDTIKYSAQRNTTGLTVAGGTSEADAYVINALPLDTRAKSQDNFTITTNGFVVSAGAMLSGTPHFILCPGNEAGDATTCASAAILDRGFGASDNITDTDNRSAILVGSGSSSFYLLKHSAALDTDGVDDWVDNTTTVSTVTSDIRNIVTPPTIGTASTALSTAASQNVSFAVEGTTQYLLTSFDNGTLWSRTTGDFSKYADNISGSGASVVVLKSDGTNMIAVVDNGTRGSRAADVLRIDSSSPEQIASVSLLDNATSTASSFCAATGGGQVIVATDNGTTGMFGETTTNTVFYGGAYTGSSMPLVAGDNTTAILQLDNASVSVCDIAYGQVSGVFWFVTDNGTTGVHTLKTVDNGSSWSIHGNKVNGATNADSISLTVSPLDNELVACVNDDGAMVVRKLVDNTTWTTLGSRTVADGSAVSCAYSADGTKIGVGYVNQALIENNASDGENIVSTGDGGQKTNFAIFYD